ncbi:MAG: hypothetical protein ACR2KJ_14305 [Jatrophihabitans sp.]
MTGPYRRRRSTVLVAILLALGLAVAGCAQTVNGHGTAANTGNGTITDGTTTSSSSSSPSTSSTGSSSSAPSQVVCPTIVDGAAGLTYGCLAGAMTRVADSAGVWQVDLQVRTEANWAMNEGSVFVGSLDDNTPQAVSVAIVGAMVKGNTYGPSPSPKQDGTIAKQTVDGTRAYVQQFTIAISPAYRKTQKLAVTAERLWIVLIERGSDDYSAMFFSVPDNVKKYWATVPKLIAATKVS